MINIADLQIQHRKLFVVPASIECTPLHCQHQQNTGATLERLLQSTFAQVQHLRKVKPDPQLSAPLKLMTAIESG